jgi:hypothetical protein
MAGYVVWSGASRIDGKPIVAIVTGVGPKSERSKNEKTGEMSQVWILRRDINPIEAIGKGHDRSICGSCPLRGIIARNGRKKTNRLRSCYVSVDQAPLSIYNAYKRGAYPPLPPDLKWEDQGTRLGSYGDPSAIPFSVNKDLISRGRRSKNTGYTHQSKDRKFHPMRKLLMASVHSKEEAVELQEKGWRTFRTMQPGDSLLPNERICPASEEGGKRMTCDRCLGCSGTGLKNTRGKAISFAIVVHGSPSKLSSYNKTFEV